MKGVKIMGTASSGEWIAILLYFALVIGVGVYFFFRDRNVEGEKEYFLGGRSMGGWVAALSAGASDMSAWVLMGLPGSIYLYGIGKVWIAVGLVIGTICAWVFVAPRLRRYSIRANDSITIPQFLTNRFQSKNKGLQIISAIVFVVVYCIYSASSISACGTLFNTVTGMSAKTAMIIATAIILVYVFLGGFNAVCWTDFFQGMLMLAALMLTPILALFVMKGADFVAPVMAVPENYYNALSGGGFNWKSVSDILSGLGWGLGYFGMPHILLRFMAIREEKELNQSRRIATIWVVISMFIAVFIGVIGYSVSAAGKVPFLATSAESETIIIKLADLMSQHGVLLAVMAGIILSGILAATMSTADSQLLAAASSVSQDLMQHSFGIKMNQRTTMLAARATVIGIALIGMVLAWDPNSSVFRVVSFAWAGFGAAFGPVMLFSLFWKRANKQGALAGMITGGAVVFIWKYLIAPMGGAWAIYELLPAFLAACIAIVIVSLATPAPEKAVTDTFDEICGK